MVSLRLPGIDFDAPDGFRLSRAIFAARDVSNIGKRLRQRIALPGTTIPIACDCYMPCCDIDRIQCRSILTCHCRPQLDHASPLWRAKIPSAVLVRNRWPRERAACRCLEQLTFFVTATREISG